MSLVGFIQGAILESPLLHIGGFHACLEPLCCVVQSRHFALIGCKPNGPASFLRREFAFQFSREVSESCEFCSKQFSNLGEALLQLRDDWKAGRCFVVESLKCSAQPAALRPGC